jgi:hypothetical protein
MSVPNIPFYKLYINLTCSIEFYNCPKKMIVKEEIMLFIEIIVNLNAISSDARLRMICPFE